MSKCTLLTVHEFMKENRSMIEPFLEHRAIKADLAGRIVEFLKPYDKEARNRRVKTIDRFER